MNLLTFDIEEWYLNHKKDGPKGKYAEYDRYLEAILDKLDERGFSATFFCVGEMGRLFPDVIRRIHRRGHEIGCHSNIHTWLNKMDKEECREDTRRAVCSLEQCIGQKVRSYRAPAFSIGEKNKWAFEILVENGIERDASVFPAARDFGGFPDFGHKEICLIEYNGIRIKEFPVCTTRLMSKETAFSGGGYFRLFPLWFVEMELKKCPYSMCYFHIKDLIPESQGVMSRAAYEAYFKEPGSVRARYTRYLKSNLGKKGAFGKMMELIDRFDFRSLKEADETIDWGNVPKVVLSGIAKH